MQQYLRVFCFILGGDGLGLTVAALLGFPVGSGSWQQGEYNFFKFSFMVIHVVQDRINDPKL